MSGEKDSKPEPRRERRKLVRHPGRASVTVLRQTDIMRVGLPAKLRDITVAGLGVQLQTPLEVGEWVELELRNEIQKFSKRTRGVVRHVTPTGRGDFLVGIDLDFRLTPLEVSLMKMAFPKDQSEGPTWI